MLTRKKYRELGSPSALARGVQATRADLSAFNINDVHDVDHLWFKTGKIVSGFDLTAQMKNNRHFNAGYASAMQQTCINVGEAFKSFKQLLSKSKKGDLNQYLSQNKRMKRESQCNRVIVFA